MSERTTKQDAESIVNQVAGIAAMGAVGVTTGQGERAAAFVERVKEVLTAAFEVDLGHCEQQGQWCSQHDAEHWPCAAQRLREARAALRGERQ